MTHAIARRALPVLTAVLMAGCVSLEPGLEAPEPPVQDTWPIAPGVAGADAARSEAAAVPVAEIGWREFFVDDRLEELVALALRNNRDLRAATLNVERARALYRVRRADRVPSLDGSIALARRDVEDGLPPELYRAEVGVTAFELDLFGRVRSLGRSALEQYFAEREARRGLQLSLIAEVAQAYLTLAADMELQRLADETLQSQEESYRLTAKRRELGAGSALELSQARTTVESARADAAVHAGNVARDRNALTLLTGGAADPALLPAGFEPEVSGLGALPAGIPSEVLLRRPDVLQAEHSLRAANASIGAARAAFFPAISLTGSVGTASRELDGLFESGTGTWSFVPQVSLPIFQGGRLRAGLGVARADRDIALARYERAIQAGFREVADALALTRTLARERQARQALVQAAAEAHELAQARYGAGLDSYLVALDSQRAYYAAQQSLISVRLAEQANRVTLYKALGGGWREHRQ